MIIFFYRKYNKNPYISCTRRYGRMCVYRRCSPGACLLNVPVGFQARKAVLCLLGLHSESKPFQSLSTVEIPGQAVGGKKAEPFQVETGLTNGFRRRNFHVLNSMYSMPLRFWTYQWCKALCVLVLFPRSSDGHLLRIPNVHGASWERALFRCLPFSWSEPKIWWRNPIHFLRIEI